jgi:hypothetical protein
MKYFGNYNLRKKRYSFSGRCIPKFGKWSYNGNKFEFDEHNNLFLIYSYEHDQRNVYIPKLFRKQEYIVLQYWKIENLRKKVENKFNVNGFIIFEKDKEKKYSKLLIGNKININNFVKMFKNGDIIFDSGMYSGNSRNYSHFRASDSIWKNLVIEEYG